MIVALFALLGILVGALANQIGSDLAARRSLTRPHCPYCAQERPGRQWISLAAYLAWRYRCPSCGAPISLRHPLTEIGLAVAYGYLWIGFGASVKLVVYLVYAAIFAIVLITDLERRLILNKVTYPAILFAFAASFVLPDMTWWSALAGGGVGFAFFFGAALVGNAVFGSGAMGGGDVMLATFVGLATGFPLVIEALVLSMLVGAAASLVLWITGLRRLRDHIPYGPFIVIGAVITLLWGYPILDWYMYR